MKISDIVNTLGLEVISGQQGLTNEIKGCYVSDLLSDVMGNAREGEVWITLQTHQNIIAVASLKDLAGIILVKSLVPETETVEKSNTAGVPVLSTSLDTFTIAGKIIEKGMRLFRADLHIHTVLSPCGDLDMSPGRIVEEALRKGLDIIGITDHNSTLHCSITARMASKKGIYVMQGAEVTTKEEVHCLAFFENIAALEKFQVFLNTSLSPIMNDPEKFGFQFVVDENEIIVYEEKRLLINALNKSLEEVESFVHSLNGLFIPAHIDRKKNSIYSQLGFMPDDLRADALEVSYALSPAQFEARHPEINRFSIIRSSDAHFPSDIGRETTSFYLENASFQEINDALAGLNGRTIETT
jgi:hypothetical protein